MEAFIIYFLPPMIFLVKNLKKIFLAVTFASIISFSLVSAAQVSEFGGSSSIMDNSGHPIMLASNNLQKGKRIDINLATQTLTRYQDGKAIGSYKISSGKRSMPTPKGTFEIHSKARRAWSEEYKLFMPYWMAFTPSGSHGIHELPEWPNGAKEGAKHLGVPVSHGCVRLGVGAARAVYDWAPVGTPVIIH
ncbi:MAG TPA: hypothetical protein DIC35_02130 [Candidatus Moranbacteria bacterium]|nr:hypothetical protein [Candidatus Moranbacteria bacterium]